MKYFLWMGTTCGCVDRNGRAKGGQHLEVWALTDRVTHKVYIVCALDLTEMLRLISVSQRPGELPKLLREHGTHRFTQALKSATHGIGNISELANEIADAMRQQGHVVECI